RFPSQGRNYVGYPQHPTEKMAVSRGFPGFGGKGSVWNVGVLVRFFLGPSGTPIVQTLCGSEKSHYAAIPNYGPALSFRCQSGTRAALADSESGYQMSPANLFVAPTRKSNRFRDDASFHARPRFEPP